MADVRVPVGLRRKASADARRVDGAAIVIHFYTGFATHRRCANLSAARSASMMLRMKWVTWASALSAVLSGRHVRQSKTVSRNFRMASSIAGAGLRANRQTPYLARISGQNRPNAAPVLGFSCVPASRFRNRPRPAACGHLSIQSAGTAKFRFLPGFVLEGGDADKLRIHVEQSAARGIRGEIWRRGLDHVAQRRFAQRGYDAFADGQLQPCGAPTANTFCPVRTYCDPPISTAGAESPCTSSLQVVLFVGHGDVGRVAFPFGVFTDTSGPLSATWQLVITVWRAMTTPLLVPTTARIRC